MAKRKMPTNPEFIGIPRLFLILSGSGDNRTRTCDPLHVKQMLSQLSYVSLLPIIPKYALITRGNFQFPT